MKNKHFFTCSVISLDVKNLIRATLDTQGIFPKFTREEVMANKYIEELQFDNLTGLLVSTFELNRICNLCYCNTFHKPLQTHCEHIW